MAMEPAAISARPAITMMLVVSTVPERPAANAKGTVRPSDIPITMSRTTSVEVEWCSVCCTSFQANKTGGLIADGMLKMETKGGKIPRLPQHAQPGHQHVTAEGL